MLNYQLDAPFRASVITNSAIDAHGYAYFKALCRIINRAGVDLQKPNDLYVVHCALSEKEK